MDLEIPDKIKTASYIKKKNMTEFVDNFSNELTFETVSAHDIALLHSLPPGLAQHILDYAETIPESEESEGAFLDREGWDSTSYVQPQVSTEVILQMAGGGDHAWWYILKFAIGQEIDPIVYIEDIDGNRQLQRGKTLIVCHRVDGGEEYIHMVDINYDLANYDTEEYDGFWFYYYHNPTLER